VSDPNERFAAFEEDLPPLEAAGSRKLLNDAVDTYKISFDSLTRLTGIGSNDLEAYSSGDTDLEHLDSRQRSAALDLIAFLGMGINTPEIPPEERLRAIMKGLEDEFGLTAETLALHSGVEPSDAQRFLAGRKVAAEKRFKLSVGVLFLYFLIYRKTEI
jgi:hypothetical protein